jgi:Chalcone and stilbene synthases, C-terminal domain
VTAVGAGIARTRTMPSKTAGERPRADHGGGASAYPSIAGLATADSADSYTQEEVLTRLGLDGDEFAERIFARCGVRQRHLNLSEGFLARTLQGRAAQVEEELLRSAIRAVEELEIDPAEIKTVGSAIFGDGCAAALLRREGAAGGPAILATQVHQLGDTLGAVSLAVEEDDSHLHLARELPDLAGNGLGALVGDFLSANHLDAAAIDHWIVHPGGRRIIERVRDALALSDADVEVSWQALADHGNVGTPSIFYVLQSTVEQRRPRPGDRGLAVTIGPGVTVGLMLLRW